MAFKFSLLNLERNECDCSEHSETMARKRFKSKKQNSQQKKFSKAVSKCHKTPTKAKFYKCMSRELRKKK